MTHPRVDPLPHLPADGAVGRYVYGIVGCATPVTIACAPIGGGGGRVYTIHEGEIGALVSATPLVHYEPTRENQSAHDLVVTTASRECAFVPLPFGTVLRGEEEVLELLRSGYCAFMRALQRLHDKVEYDLKVLWDRSRATATIERQSQQALHLRREIERRATGSTYYARASLQHVLDSELRDAEDRLVAAITERLRQVVVASRSTRPLGDRVIMSATCLVERREVPAFERVLQELVATHGDAIAVRHSGPAPPHSFLSVQLGLRYIEPQPEGR